MRDQPPYHFDAWLGLAGYSLLVDEVTAQDRDDQVKWASYVAPA